MKDKELIKVSGAGVNTRGIIVREGMRVTLELGG